jgi:hypothetical protein
MWPVASAPPSPCAVTATRHHRYDTDDDESTEVAGARRRATGESPVDDMAILFGTNAIGAPERALTRRGILPRGRHRPLRDAPT